MWRCGGLRAWLSRDEVRESRRSEANKVIHSCLPKSKGGGTFYIATLPLVSQTLTIAMTIASLLRLSRA